MPRGGKRRGAGRPRGALDGPNAAQVRRAQQQGTTPVDTLLYKQNWWMRVVAQEIQKAFSGGIEPNHKVIAHALDKACEASREAAPYVNRRLSSVRVESEPFDLTRLTDSELDQFIALRQKCTVVTIDAVGSEEARD